MSPHGLREDPQRTDGLLTVSAHPDDETLANGALLATWSAAGGQVTVVTCTRGERGEVIGAELAHLEGDGRALAAHRELELSAALGALGVTDHLFLDELAPTHAGTARTRRITDSGMSWVAPGRAGRSAAVDGVADDAFTAADVEALAESLAAVIRDRGAAVVVCDEPGGGYGHPDHVQAHRVTMRAVELVEQDDAASRVPVVLWTVLDEAALRDAYRALERVAGDGLTAPDPAGPVPSAAVARGRVDVVVDVAPVLGRVLEAMGAHATQVTAVQRLGESDRAGGPLAAFALSNGVLAPVLSRETYRHAGRAPLAGVRWPPGVTAAVA